METLIFYFKKSYDVVVNWTFELYVFHRSVNKTPVIGE
jgi:hypothetical protein